MERASHRVFGLPPGLQMPGAAANGTHRHLHALGGPADRVRPLNSVARAPLRRPPRRMPYWRPSAAHVHATRRAPCPEASAAAADGWRRCRRYPPPPPIAWRSSRRRAATQTGSCLRGLSGLPRIVSIRAPNYRMPSEPHVHARSEPPIAWLAFRCCRRWLAPLPMVPTATSMRVAAQPTACYNSNWLALAWSERPPSFYIK